MSDRKPVPWHAKRGEHSGRLLWINAADGTTLFLATPDATEEDTLIAAAGTDLLAALAETSDGLRRLLEFLGGDRDEFESEYAALEMADAAIAQAEGSKS